MKLLAYTLVGAFTALPALAQQGGYTPTSQVLLQQALTCENMAVQEINALKVQLASVTKERDALQKAADALAKPETSPSQPDPNATPGK